MRHKMADLSNFASQTRRLIHFCVNLSLPETVNFFEQLSSKLNSVHNTNLSLPSIKLLDLIDFITSKTAFLDTVLNFENLGITIKFRGYEASPPQNFTSVKF